VGLAATHLVDDAVTGVSHIGSGTGLPSMQARARRLGATLQVASTPGCTRLTACVPLATLTVPG
jgi:signal transduction histidine kinase